MCLLPFHVFRGAHMAAMVGSLVYLMVVSRMKTRQTPRWGSCMVPTGSARGE